MIINKKMMQLARLLKIDGALFGIEIQYRLGWHVGTTYNRLARLIKERTNPLFSFRIVDGRKLFYLKTSQKRLETTENKETIEDAITHTLTRLADESPQVNRSTLRELANTCERIGIEKARQAVVEYQKNQDSIGSEVEAIDAIK